MKYLVMISILMLPTPPSAFADGFKCVGQNTGLHLDIFNRIDSADGTHTPAMMWISDLTRAEGSQTLATFTEDKLISQNGNYQAKVDLRAIGSFHKDAIIGGVKLTELKAINLALNISADLISGKASYLKRTGESTDETIVCARYLKD